MYLETSGQKFGDRARLASPNLKGQCTLRMFYHMFGVHINSLTVSYRTTSDGPLTMLLNLTGHAGDNWLRKEVAVNADGKPYQIVIEGQTFAKCFPRTGGVGL